jgi:hypothetical protein
LKLCEHREDGGQPWLENPGVQEMIPGLSFRGRESADRDGEKSATDIADGR